jgi:proteasome lid subunit RPN8/RPN11
MVEAMFAHAVWAFPNETCGLLAMDANDDLQMVFCLTNHDQSEHRFTIDPAEHFGCIRYAERNGWRIGGVFHSHTKSQPYPSDADVDGGGDPSWLNVIVGPVVGLNPSVRAFRFDEGVVSEASVTIEP